ncbi:MAG: pitrilysin family protein [Candidatus Saccharicenans sp.]
MNGYSYIKRWPQALALFALLWFLFPAQSQAQEKFRKSPPYPDPVPQLVLPAVETGEGVNGLKILVISRENACLFNLQVIIRAGESDSPLELPGLATVTSRLLLRGTASMSASDIEERLDYLAVDASLEVESDYTIFSFTFLEENLEAALSLISLFFVEPTFSPLEVSAVKREFYYELLRRNQDPENAGYSFFIKKLFSGSGYNPGVLEEDAIKNISPRDVTQFHQRYLRPNNSVIVFNGNINLDKATGLTNQYFRRWVPRPVSRPSVPRLPNRDFGQVCFLDVPGNEVAIIAGNLIAPISSPDYFSLLVLNHLLGGSTGSRLFLTLRELKGEAFYSFSELTFFRGNGIFWVRAKTSPAALTSAVKSILNILSRLPAERIEAEEHERAKSYLIGNLPLQFENAETMSRRIALLDFLELPADFWTRYFQNIMLVDVDSVREVARKYLSTRPLVVIAGEATRTLDYLKDFDKIEVYNRKGQFLGVLEKGVLRYENR